MKIRIGLWFGVLLAAISGSAQNFNHEEAADLNQTFFISEIFNKYGNNNTMTYEGFEHLLENLGLGKLKFETKHDVSLHKVNGTFREFHDELSLHRHNHKGSNPSIKQTDEEKINRRKRNIKTEENIEKTLRKCLTAQDILTTYGLKPYHEVIISPSKYLEMCPAIVYELDQKLCQVKEEESTGRGQREQHLVWIYASVSILTMGLSGILCILAVPLIKKDYYSWFLQFLVSLAVGTLCGDALIHLIPQIFSTDGKPGSEMTVISRGAVTLLAVYFFFLVENVLKIVQNMKTKNVEDGKELRAMMPPHESHEHYKSRGGGDEIKTVAWMAILGDILHNVTDGLSIGAAFETSLSSGFASSIAIFCHELPHELGDYAILLASGMSVKNALFYNIVSSAFSFAGLVAGILVGEIKEASSWINAFTAGSFLYIALSDLVPEMKIAQTNSNLKNFSVQIMGLACGGVLMFTIALYEDQIERMLC